MDSINQQFLEIIEAETKALLGLEKFNELDETNNGYLFLSDRMARLCKNAKRIAIRLYDDNFINLNPEFRRGILTHLLNAHYQNLSLDRG